MVRWVSRGPLIAAMSLALILPAIPAVAQVPDRRTSAWTIADTRDVTYLPVVRENVAVALHQGTSLQPSGRVELMGQDGAVTIVTLDDGGES